MWKGIHFSFKPAQAYRHHHGKKPLFWPQLVLIVVPVSIGKTQDGAHKKKVFFSSVSWCCFHFPVWTHCSLGLFSCVELHFGLLSAVEKLMYLQDCGFGEMFVTISSMSALVRPLPAWAFMCIFKLCPLKDGFMHIYHAESLSPVSSDHVDLQTLPTEPEGLSSVCSDHVDFQTLPTWENFRTTSAFVSSFSRNKAFTQRELSGACSSCFHKKNFSA